MVKVTIESDGETIVYVGEFVFGSVVSEAGDSYAANSFLIGEMDSKQLPMILANVTAGHLVEIGKDKEFPDATVIDLMADYGLEVDKIAKREVLARKDTLLRDISLMPV